MNLIQRYKSFIVSLTYISLFREHIFATWTVTFFVTDNNIRKDFALAHTFGGTVQSLKGALMYIILVRFSVNTLELSGLWDLPISGNLTTLHGTGKARLIGPIFFKMVFSRQISSNYQVLTKPKGVNISLVTRFLRKWLLSNVDPSIANRTFLIVFPVFMV